LNILQTVVFSDHKYTRSVQGTIVRSAGLQLRVMDVSFEFLWSSY
jgi:hypothetical protein